MHARADNTLQVTDGPIGESARQSACEARPKARYAPLAAYAAPVVEGCRVNPRLGSLACDRTEYDHSRSFTPPCVCIHRQLPLLLHNPSALSQRFS